MPTSGSVSLYRLIRDVNGVAGAVLNRINWILRTLG